MAAAAGASGRLYHELDTDALLQLDANSFGGQVETRDPPVELVGLHAEAARQPMRTAEHLRGVESGVDEIRHTAM